MSEDIADELGRRITIAGDEILPSIEDFLDRYGCRPAQLALPLRGT